MSKSIDWMRLVLGVTIAVCALLFTLIVTGCAGRSYYDCVSSCERRWHGPEEAFLKRECLANCDRELSGRTKE
jgi:hypothetical protein